MGIFRWSSYWGGSGCPLNEKLDFCCPLCPRRTPCRGREGALGCSGGPGQLLHPPGGLKSEPMAVNVGREASWSPLAGPSFGPFKAEKLEAKGWRRAQSVLKLGSRLSWEIDGHTRTGSVEPWALRPGGGANPQQPSAKPSSQAPSDRPRLCPWPTRAAAPKTFVFAVEPTVP